jgi:enoyl-CoA hydratase
MSSSQLQQLLDDREIEQLLFEYCRAADANDPEALAECFTEDCVARYAPGPQSVGREARRDQAARDLTLFSATSHQLSNVSIDYLDADRARVESVVHGWHQPTEDGCSWQLWARYRDLAQRTPSGWRIAERELLLVGEDGFPPDWTWLHADRAQSGRGSSTQAAHTDDDAAPVQVTARGAVLSISIFRPDVRNAFDHATAQQVSAALDRLEEDDDLLVGILHGAGGVFSAGMDLRAFITGETPETAEHGLLGLVRRRRSKPLIAAVDGYAIGAGFEVALACDLIVAARDAWFALPEVSRGLVPAGGALRNLPLRVPHGVAVELTLTGSRMTARRAFSLGLVARLADPRGSLETALGLAAEITRGSPAAVRAGKAVLDGQADWSEDEFWDRQAEIVEPVFAAADAVEGATAYLERRTPTWQVAPDTQK